MPFSAWPMCSEPVTFGGGSAMQYGSPGASGSASNACASSPPLEDARLDAGRVVPRALVEACSQLRIHGRKSTRGGHRARAPGTGTPGGGIRADTHGTGPCWRKRCLAPRRTSHQRPPPRGTTPTRCPEGCLAPGTSPRRTLPPKFKFHAPGNLRDTAPTAAPTPELSGRCPSGCQARSLARRRRCQAPLGHRRSSEPRADGRERRLVVGMVADLRRDLGVHHDAVAVDQEHRPAELARLFHEHAPGMRRSCAPAGSRTAPSRCPISLPRQNRPAAYGVSTETAYAATASPNAATSASNRCVWREQTGVSSDGTTLYSRSRPAASSRPTSRIAHGAGLLHDAVEAGRRVADRDGVPSRVTGVPSSVTRPGRRVVMPERLEAGARG